MSSSQAPVRCGAGSITRLPSGSLRVRVYTDPDPLAGPLYIVETVADGPLAREQAEEVCRRLLGQVRRSRRMHSHATVNDLLNRQLAMTHIGERSRRSHLTMAAKHLRPFIGDQPLRAVTQEKLEYLYAELLTILITLLIALLATPHIASTHHRPCRRQPGCAPGRRNASGG